MSHSLSTLGAEATIIMGQSPPGESYNRNRKGAPLLNGPSEFGSVCPIEVQWTTSPTKLCQPGDVLFCVRGATAGRLNTADKEYCIGRGLAAIRGRTGKFDNGFLRYVLDNGYARFQSRGVGSTFINISADELARFPVPIFPLPEQRRIAAILDKADELRAKRRAALVKLDTLTESIFLDMFGDPATNPKGWTIRKLDELADKITDGEHLNPEFSSTGMPIVMAGDVLNDGVELESAKSVDLSLGLRFRKKCDPSVGDLLLVSRGATIGRQCVVNNGEPFCLMGSVILIKPQRDSIEPCYLNAYLKHPVVRSTLYRTSGSSAQQAIYLKDLRKMKCMLPPLSLQAEFVRHVHIVTSTKLTHWKSLKELEGLFTALQHRAFRGDLPIVERSQLTA
jgi:type I restriction enzyme, S subunit